MSLQPIKGAESLGHLERLRDLFERPMAGGWEFEAVPLREVVAWIGEKQGLTITLDRRSLEDVGIALDTPITFTYQGGSLATALRLLLQDLDLTFIPIDIRQEQLQIQITTSDTAESKMVLVTFPVRDLTTVGQLVPGQYDYQGLISQITSTIAPQIWSDVSGGPATITGSGDIPAIAVSAPWPVQMEIMDYLSDLRRIRVSYGSTKNTSTPQETESLRQLQRLRARFSKSVTQPWRLDDVPLETAVKQIGAIEGIDIRLDSQVATDLSLAAITRKNEQLRAAGFVPVDVSSYLFGEERYGAVWERTSADAPNVEAFFGQRAAEYEKKWNALRSAGFEARTYHIMAAADGSSRRNMVWVQTNRKNGFRQGFQDTYEERMSQDLCPTDVGLTRGTAKSGEFFAWYSTCYVYDETPVAAERHGLDPPAHLAECKQLAARGYIPVAVVACQVSPDTPLVAASVWHLE